MQILCCFCQGYRKAGKGGHEQLGAFVTKPYTKWATAKEAFKRLSEADYHKTYVTVAEN